MKTPIHPKPIEQFSPTLEHPDYPGAYGWGYDTHGYRIVVYGPAEEDHPEVREKLRILKDHNEVLDRDRMVMRRKEEHGPAHIHVFHLQHKHESRLELIEDQYGEHKFRHLPWEGKHKGRIDLADHEMQEVAVILKKDAGRFIQLWRELHQDSRLSAYVTRQDWIRESKRKYTPVEVRVQKNGWTAITNKHTGETAVEPPVNMNPSKGRFMSNEEKGQER